MPLKLRIMLRAVAIRVEKGEELGAVLESYPKLSEEEKHIIREEIEKD